MRARTSSLDHQWLLEMPHQPGPNVLNIRPLSYHKDDETNRQKCCENANPGNEQTTILVTLIEARNAALVTSFWEKALWCLQPWPQAGEPLAISLIPHWWVSQPKPVHWNYQCPRRWHIVAATCAPFSISVQELG